MPRKNEYDLAAAFRKIEDELIASMIRNMDRHRAEETKEGYNWSMWQTEQLKALEKYKVRNQKKYSKQFKSINDQIDSLIRMSRSKGGMQQERRILQAIKKGFKGAKMVHGILFLIMQIWRSEQPVKGLICKVKEKSGRNGALLQS